MPSYYRLQTSIENKIIPEPMSGCWLWEGSIGKHGYAKIRNGGGTTLVHKILYEQKFGCVPEGLELDHICRNPYCVNPDHLEAVTHQVNVLRGIGPTAQNAQKTHCKYGHLLEGKNLIAHEKGTRNCRACARKYGREYAYMHRTVHRHSKLFCKRGHRLGGNNLYIEHTKRGDQKRRCRECNRIKERARNLRRRKPK